MALAPSPTAVAPAVVIAFAPGAGAGSGSAWMRAWAERLARFGSVEPFDYPYRRAGRRAPDALPVLVAAHRAELGRALAAHPEARAVVLAGKSMGGRIGCHVALEERVDALICFGYPLRGANGSLRDQVLFQLSTPILFVQGTRDALCPIDQLQSVRARMRAPSELCVVEGGNHSLEVPRGRPAKGGAPEELTPQQVSDARVLTAVDQFLTRVRSESRP